MIYTVGEGKILPIGISLYPAGSGQVGFRIRIRNSVFQIRYSKIIKKWFVGNLHIASKE